MQKDTWSPMPKKKVVFKGHHIGHGNAENLGKPMGVLEKVAAETTNQSVGET